MCHIPTPPPRNNQQPIQLNLLITISHHDPVCLKPTEYKIHCGLTDIVIYRSFCVIVMKRNLDRSLGWYMFHWPVFSKYKSHNNFMMTGRDFLNMNSSKEKAKKAVYLGIFRAKTIAYRNLAIDCITHKFLYYKLIPIWLKLMARLKYS